MSTTTTDSRVEAFLHSIGAKFAYRNEVSYRQLMAKWELDNLGRKLSKNPRAIESYGNLIDRGSPPPSPIVWELPRVKPRSLRVLDGIQRLLAMETRGIAHFNAYEVLTKSEGLVKKIRVYANIRLQGGFSETPEWTLTQAIEQLVFCDLATIEEVADLGGWSRSYARCKLETVRTNMYVVATGGPELPDTVLRTVAGVSELNDFDKASEPIAAFLHHINDMKLSGEDAEPFVRDFFDVRRARCRTALHDQFAGKLKEFQSHPDIEPFLNSPLKARSAAMTPQGKLLRNLRASKTTAEAMLAGGDRLEEPEVAKLLLNQISKIITQLSKRKGRKK